MPKFFLASFMLLSLGFYAVTAQEVGGSADQSIELLTSLSAQERADVVNRNQLDYAAIEYFAKPGRIDVFKFNLETLEKIGTTVTISTSWGEPIEIKSHGLERRPEWAGKILKWHGEMKSSNSEKPVPVTMDIVVRSIDTKGNVHPPDPNRDITLRELENENYTVLAESAARIDERLIYSLATNFLFVPDQMMMLNFSSLGEHYEAMVVSENDPSKQIVFSHDRVVGGDPSTRQQNQNSPAQNEALRRQKEFKDYMEDLEREISSNQN